MSGVAWLFCGSAVKGYAGPQVHAQKRQVVLFEDLPDLLHASTQARFQAALQSLCVEHQSCNLGPPVAIIVSDSGLRAEQPDDNLGWGKQ